MATRPLSLAQACARYVNRYTADHVPYWTKMPCAGNGLFYAPQFVSDAEWYANTLFYGESGFFGERGECYTSGQTWPFGQWLGAAYQIGVTPVKAVEQGSYVAITVDGEQYEFNEDSVCAKRDDGDFEFWFYHKLAFPTADTITPLIRGLTPKHSPLDVMFIAAANERYASDDIEFDDVPKVSVGDGGAFVQAWVWVTDDQVGVDSESE